MDLPRELRDGVYRELLLPTERLPNKKKRRYALQPAILRVCKQTYQEASRVLYKETNWVLVTSSEDVDDRWSLRVTQKIGFPFIYFQNPLFFPGTFVLRMEMSGSLDADHKYQDSMLIPQRHFQLFGKTFLAPNCACTTLRFDEDAMQNPATREVRTFRTASFLFGSGLVTCHFSRAESSFTLQKCLVASMKRRISVAEEFFFIL